MGRFMPSESETSAPAVGGTLRMFCKKCGYALVGLESRVCPECGLGFDPGNRKTFSRKPPRGWVWRWGKRVAAVVLLLMLAAGAGLGWLWWGWHAEQSTIARLRAINQHFTVASIGPQRLRWVLGGRLGYLAERVDSAEVHDLRAAETERLDFRSLTQIKKLVLLDCEVSNRELNRLAGLAKLRELGFYGLRIEKPDLAFLEKLPALTKLVLMGSWVHKAGFEDIRQLGHLKVLIVPYTSLNDAELQQFGGSSSLEELRTDWISDGSFVHLKRLKSLKRLHTGWRQEALDESRGVAKLKQAIPGLQVIGG
jgi:hypothetical protein